MRAFPETPAAAAAAPAPSATVSFQLPTLRFPVLRNFLDIMPLKDLYILRQKVPDAARFRGDIMDIVCVASDNAEQLNPQLEGFFPYSQFMGRHVPLKPADRLEVYMGNDICPEALKAKLVELEYSNLYIKGEYEWKQVFNFLHAGVKCVCLYDNLNLPLEDMEDFFKALLSYKISKVNFFNKNCNELWAETATKVWQTLTGTALQFVESRFNFVPEVRAVTNDDRELILSMNCWSNEDEVESQVGEPMDMDDVDDLEEFDFDNININEDLNNAIPVQYY
uniref:F-box domain-containing protein n=1 Tax=Panagrellus redivivus TaxID=6233 RepID=A0A7E4VHP7_PANRE